MYKILPPKERLCPGFESMTSKGSNFTAVSRLTQLNPNFVKPSNHIIFFFISYLTTQKTSMCTTKSLINLYVIIMGIIRCIFRVDFPILSCWRRQQCVLSCQRLSSCLSPICIYICYLNEIKLSNWGKSFSPHIFKALSWYQSESDPPPSALPSAAVRRRPPAVSTGDYRVLCASRSATQRN